MILDTNSSFRRLLAAIGIALGIATATVAASTSISHALELSNFVGDTRELAASLRAGGYVILLRHGATFSDQADTDPFNLADSSNQRNLNNKGKALAKSFGAALNAANVPIGQVYTSQFNRAYETATLAGFKNIEKTVDLSEGGLVVTPDENSRRAQALRNLLSKLPAPGKNDILITHKPNIIDALGKDWFDVKEGEASIFKPEGGKYRLIARVQMEDWPKLANAAY